MPPRPRKRLRLVFRAASVSGGALIPFGLVLELDDVASGSLQRKNAGPSCPLSQSVKTDIETDNLERWRRGAPVVPCGLPGEQPYAPSRRFSKP